MTEPEKQIKEIKDALLKYQKSLENPNTHRPLAANAVIHEVQEILQIKWVHRLSCS